MENLSAFAIPRKCDIPAGAYGVWQIPDLNIMIPVYQGNNATQQAIVDKDNSALIQKYGAGRVIVDHAGSKSSNSKGSWQMQNVKPDDVAFLVKSDGTDQYTCFMVCKVDVLTSCYMLYGQVLYPRKSTDILCLCCADPKGKTNYCAAFRYVGKMP